MKCTPPNAHKPQLSLHQRRLRFLYPPLWSCLVRAAGTRVVVVVVAEIGIETEEEIEVEAAVRVEIVTSTVVAMNAVAAGAMTGPKAAREVTSAAEAGAGAGAGAGVQSEIVKRGGRKFARSGTNTVVIASGANYVVTSIPREKGRHRQR